MDIKIFGVKATVYLKYHEEIDKLAKLISQGLKLPDFILEHDESPPYQISGSCESLGFEIWLEKNNVHKDFSYMLKIETELSMKESFNNQMYDISPWLARYISKICDVESMLYDESLGAVNIFKIGEDTPH